MELLNWMATWPAPVRIGLLVAGWGIGIRIGMWAADLVMDHFDERKAQRHAAMRNVTPQ